MEQQILDFIMDKGLPVFVIASCIIAFIGILKLCKLFDKITNKDILRAVYFACNVVLAFGFSAIYFAIFKKEFNLIYVQFSLAQLTSTLALYQIYKSAGLRKLVQSLISAITKLFNKDKLKELAGKLGLSEEFVNSLIKVDENATEKEINAAKKEVIADLKEAQKVADKKTKEKKELAEKEVKESKAKASEEQKSKAAEEKAKIDEAHNSKIITIANEILKNK